jgi:thioredoxin-related protein
MIKKSLITVGLVIFFAGALIMVYFIVENIALKKSISEKIQTFSTDKLYTLDSVQFQLTESRPMLLFFFNSECEHCQYELKELKKNLPAFHAVSILLMSSENIISIKEALQKFNLSSSSNVEFLKINQSDVFGKFGSLSVPHLFIYGADRKLIKEFKGETKIKAILQHLPR